MDIRIKNYQSLNKYAKKRQILFTGSSLMEQFPVCELAAALGLDRIVYNRGVGGYTTDDFLREIDTVLFDLEPSRVFINIGTNDIREWEDGRDWMEHLLCNYEKILKMSRERLPETEFTMMAYYPVNGELQTVDPWVKQALKVRTNENIALANKHVAKLAADFGHRFINVNQGLTDEVGKLKKEFTVEGIHMYANGYEVVLENMRPFL